MVLQEKTVIWLGLAALMSVVGAAFGCGPLFAWNLEREMRSCERRSEKGKR